MDIPKIIFLISTFFIFPIGYIFFLIHKFEGLASKIKSSNLELEEIQLKKNSSKELAEKFENKSKAAIVEYLNKAEQLESIKNEIEEKKNVLNKQNKNIEESLKVLESSSNNYLDILEEKYTKKENEMDDLEEKISDLKTQFSKAAAAQLKEREKEEKLDFYKLSLPIDQEEDVKHLYSIKESFRNPKVISKIIWSEYFQKQTNDLCNRVLGTEPKTGIYKITNLITKQSYIGQSVKIQDRFKQHIKCGLGIDAASNKLYNQMQKYGVWNFTFELLEECEKDKLNEKEKFWINLYQTDKFGMNSTQGGS